MDDFSDPIWSSSLRTVDGKNKSCPTFCFTFASNLAVGSQLKPSEFFRIFFLLPFPNDYLILFTCLIELSNIIYIFKNIHVVRGFPSLPFLIPPRLPVRGLAKSPAAHAEALFGSLPHLMTLFTTDLETIGGWRWPRYAPFESLELWPWLWVITGYKWDYMGLYIL